MADEVSKTDEEWKASLTSEQYRVLRRHGTERAGTSPLDHEKRQGTFHCAGCGLPLFASEAKFNSGTGWPSFFQPLDNAVETQEDRSWFMRRTEVHCRRCGGHLGHVFPDGPEPTGLRYCMNGVAMIFERSRGEALFPPRRIVCLTEETVETLYLLGEQARIVGISGYVVRPPEARRDKPRVSAFTSADIGKILKLDPDLVLAFSDLQADIVADLVRRGIAVHAFNQRSVAGILDMVRLLGAMVGAGERAASLAGRLEAELEAARARAQLLGRRPRVYFEEWDEPMIAGIGWVSELIVAAGGIDIFADRAMGRSAKERIVTADEVVARQPDIVIGSWCGKKFRPEKVRARPGFARMEMHEIKSALILQPGPAALTDGFAALERIVRAWGQADASR